MLTYLSFTEGDLIVDINYYYTPPVPFLGYLQPAPLNSIITLTAPYFNFHPS